MIRFVLLTAGTASLVLGIVGIFVPLLPTTPFLLLAAACFARSSDRAYQWLINHPWFGWYIQSYREHRAIPTRAKISALVLLWTAISVSVLAIIPLWQVSVGLIAIAAAVSVYLVRLKTLTPVLIAERARSAIQPQPERRAA